MASLYIIRGLPNPAGKDRTPRHQITNEQLNGEWVEFENVGESDDVAGRGRLVSADVRR